MADASPLLLQLLAQPRLLRAGAPVHVGSRKAMAVLALLALDRSGARARLTALLWPEADPAAGRRNLRRELFRLRELGVALREDADGALALEAGLEVDALRLLADDGVPETAGVAFDGLDGVGSVELDAWLHRWREQLAARLAHNLERQASIRERAGDVTAALALQQRRLAADPLHEAAALEVMRLKAAQGDRAGALHSYRQLADALRDELSVAPSAAAASFAAALREASDGGFGTTVPGALAPSPSSPPSPIASAAALAVVTAEPARGLPPIVPFVSREQPQRQIQAAWAEGRRVYLHGPAGTGKTRLACELAAARGPWLRVACEPQDAELPYASVVRLLRALRDSAPGVALPEWVQRELAQLMPELGSPPAALATDEARQRLLAAVAQAWRLLMQDNFSAFVLDDWHWGDPASVELWARLDDGAVRTDASAVSWVIAYRSAQLSPAAAARQQADLDSRRGASVALEGFAEAEVRALTHRLSGAGGGQLFSQRLHAATEGNPFFLLETLRHLFERGLLVADERGWSTPFDEHTSDYAELPVPPSVRAAVLSRVRALGESARRLLEAASLISGSIDPRLLAEEGGADEEAVLLAFERAEEAQLIVDADDGWRFAHDLVRQSLAASLSSARRRWLHERLARRLEALEGPPALIASHLEAAQLPAAAVRWRVAAAESALHVHAVNEALANYERAIADGARGVEAATIQLARSRLHWRRADRKAADEAVAAAAEAIALDAAASPAELLRVQLAQVDHLRQSDRFAAALELLDALAPELARAAPPERAQALIARGSILMVQGRLQETTALTDEALGLLESDPGQRPALGTLLLQSATAAYRGGDLPAFGRLARRAVSVHETLDAPSELSSALCMLAAFHLEGGDHGQARAFGERAQAVARDAGDVPMHRRAIFNLVKGAFHGNDVERAGRLLDEGEALAPHYENRQIEQSFLAARYYLHRLRGEAAAAVEVGNRLLDTADRLGRPLERIGFRHLVVDAPLLEGDLARARVLIDEAQAQCDLLAASGEGNHYAPQQAVKQARLALLEGRPRDALAALPAADALPVTGDRFGRSWIGCAAAMALGDLATAERELGLVDADADVDNGTLALWLEQRLAFEQATGRGDGRARARAQRLLDERRIPLMVAERLQRVLARTVPPSG